MTRKYFGTDGIRGKVGVAPITPDFVLKLGWAAGRVLARHSQGSRTRNLVIIGKDTRISGYMFESALEAGLVAAGLDVTLLGPMPTPAVAYLTRTFHAAAGIVISASHNPFDDNGIKFFSSRGTKLPDELEREIEAEMDAPMQTSDSRGLGKVTRMLDAEGRLPRMRQALVADSSAIMAGAALGTSTTTAYIESAAGVAEGTELTLMQETGDENVKALVQLFQQNLSQLGITLTIQETDLSTFAGIMYGDMEAEERPQVVPWFWWPDYNDSWNVLYPTTACTAWGSAGSCSPSAGGAPAR